MFLATHGVLRRSSAFIPPVFADTYSFEYDGVADYLEGTTTYSELDGVSKATISLWVKPSLTGTQVLSRLSNSTSSTAFVYQLFVLSTGEINMQIGDTTKRARTGTSVLTANVWSHVLVTYDGALSGGSKTKIFINGVDSTSSDGTSATSLDNASYALQIGRRDFGTSLSYLGFINEFSVWAGTDLRGDVSTIYNSGVANDLNNNGLTAPTTWLRAESSTWDGSKWTIDDENSSYQLESNNMTSASRSTDVPLFDNKSFEYDGVVDKLDCGNPVSLQITGNITLSAWINTTSSSTQDIIGKDSISSGTRSFNLVLVSGVARLTVFKSNSASSVNSTSSVDDGNWHHVLGVNDGTDLKIYVDGVLEGTNSGGGGTFDNGTSDFNIGSRDAGPQSIIFNGAIDEPAIFDYALTSTQVLDIYGSGVPTDISSLNPLGHWRAENATFDGSNWNITDSGSGGNDATSVSMTSTSRTSDVPT